MLYLVIYKAPRPFDNLHGFKNLISDVNVWETLQIFQEGMSVTFNIINLQ